MLDTKLPHLDMSAVANAESFETLPLRLQHPFSVAVKQTQNTKSKTYLLIQTVCETFTLDGVHTSMSE